jgi:hypothetical protein
MEPCCCRESWVREQHPEQPWPHDVQDVESNRVGQTDVCPSSSVDTRGLLRRDVFARPNSR